MTSKNLADNEYPQEKEKKKKRTCKTKQNTRKNNIDEKEKRMELKGNKVMRESRKRVKNCWVSLTSANCSSKLGEMKKNYRILRGNRPT